MKTAKVKPNGFGYLTVAIALKEVDYQVKYDMIHRDDMSMSSPMVGDLIYSVGIWEHWTPQYV